MNSLDLVIIIALVVGLVRGFTTGIIRQLAGIVGIVLSLLLAIQLMGPFGERIADETGWSPGITEILAFLLIFVGVQVGMFFLARLIERVVGLLQLTIVNRLAGAIFGGFKAALLVSIVLMVLASFDVPEDTTRRQSLMYDPVASLVPETWDVVARHLPAIKRISDEFGRDVEMRVQ